jgi:DNA-binding phage protein
MDNTADRTDRCSCSECQLHPNSNVAVEHRALNSLMATLDERSRRLVVGFLAKQSGRGGIVRLAQITGLSRDTIRRGQSELMNPEAQLGSRIRRSGGGRKRVEKKMSGDPGGSGRSVA